MAANTTLPTRTLGRTGFRVSDISMGCGMISDSNVVRYAYDHGMNLFDTAEASGLIQLSVSGKSLDDY